MKRILCLSAAGVCAIGCGGGLPDSQTSPRSVSPETTTFPATFARQWMTNIQNSVKGDNVAPPVAARTYAYVGVALYESVVHGMPGHRSLAGQLNGLDSLPVPDPTLEYDWPTVLAHTLHTMMVASIPAPFGSEGNGPYTYPNRIFYEYTTPTQAPLTSLGPVQVGLRRQSGVPEDIIANSTTYAEMLGRALLDWAAEDRYYDVRYNGWIAPTGPDKWVPSGFSDTDKVSNPAEPHFGSVRPLVMTTSSECAPANIGLSLPPFSTDPSSDFYQAALEVLTTDVNLTDEQREIARFWEDAPGKTTTPSGHWLDITTQRVKNLDLGTAAAAYAWISIGFVDSFIGVWQSKYDYNLLRPTTYIRRHIDPGFLTFLGTPQFPAYVSGHSGQSGASGALLTAMFGPEPFTDATKVRRGHLPRFFNDYIEAAEEAGVSRLYGGIHYRFDNEHGLALGYCVADKIVARVALQN